MLIIIIKSKINKIIQVQEKDNNLFCIIIILIKYFYNTRYFIVFKYLTYHCYQFKSLVLLKMCF